MLKKFIALSIALLFVFCGYSHAIDVKGVVKDSTTGLPISGVTVIILQTGDTAVTDGSGSYFHAGVPEGYYTFLVGRPNYSPRIMAGVRVSASCCIGNRGDVNSDGIDANILDLTYLVNRIFRGGSVPVCPIEADLNRDGISANIIDLTFLVDRIFRGGSAAGPCN